MKRILIVVTVLVVLAGGAIAGARYLKDKNSNTTTPPSQTNKQNDPSTDDKYLVIKEWGVRFRPSKEIEGVSYIYENDKVIFVIVPEISKLSGCRQAKVFGIHRGKQGDEDINTMLKEAPELLVQNGEFYYYFRHSQYTCTEKQNSDELDKFTVATQQVNEMVNTVQ